MISVGTCTIQSTVIGQWAAPFPAKYSGGNSLEPHGEVKDTFSFDVTAGIRLWRGGEFFADVLTWQGYGLSKTTGLAGFPNGEAYRLGKTYPDVIVARGYLRETVPLGGGPSPGADPNAPSEGSGGQRRLILSVGHIPVTDDFDKNAYANDPRTQFMNWAFVNNAAWDYPANSLGFSNGVSMQLDLGSWTARAGHLPRLPIRQRPEDGLESAARLVSCRGTRKAAFLSGASWRRAAVLLRDKGAYGKLSGVSQRSTKHLCQRTTRISLEVRLRDQPRAGSSERKLR